MTKLTTLNHWTKSDLMALPLRNWKTESAYDSLLLLNLRKRHDSGYALICIVGVNKGVPVEIAANCCDDIEWKAPQMKTFGDGKFSKGQFRIDGMWKSGALQAWSCESRFRVGIALSSTTIELIDREDTK